MSEKSLDSSKIAVLGAGNLGYAIAKRLKESGYEVIVTGRREAVLESLKKMGCRVTNNRDAVSEADFVIITVKPKDLDSLIDEIRDCAEGKIIISFVAMKKLEDIRMNAKIVRAMSNILCEYGLAFTAYYCEFDDDEIESILSKLGDVYKAKDEKEVDLMTAFSGSAPAFVAKIIESFIYAGLNSGLNAEVSKKCALSVFKATSEALKTQSPEEFIIKVTTPAGTTIQGLRKLMEHRVDFAIVDALQATARRAMGS
ncbi:Pyrroline-5-carboxylate reductase [Archaeoglobus sulfaticallidus PM70-1]|uniref:Pyrroline-5-carboxylate reductase n=1 Tax=Archaeoglobus sulfaticallidus PM70-1 TaxID=387631 RepID=N0BL42_9EURY|nr:pyrroline-5-carboxylate reductase [Archaeoglobus sulfaticallidus]AGK61261.1 Pyrroline-5-carboxylate reductase [Archaeoglobus sulfaticallidus PM70-1]